MLISFRLVQPKHIKKHWKEIKTKAYNIFQFFCVFQYKDY